MTEAIIVALITGAFALAGSYMANRKSAALIAYRLEQLEEKVQAHNNLIERTYELEKHNEVQDTQIKSIEKHLNDLETKVGAA